MNFKVIDEHGQTAGNGAKSRAAEVGAWRPSARDVSAGRAGATKLYPRNCSDRIVDWDFGELPDVLELRRGGQALVGYPALVDVVTHCSIEVFDTPARADAQHRAGLRRLFRLQLKEQVKFLEKSLASLQMTQMRASGDPPG